MYHSPATRRNAIARPLRKAGHCGRPPHGRHAGGSGAGPRAWVGLRHVIRAPRCHSPDGAYGRVAMVSWRERPPMRVRRRSRSCRPSDLKVERVKMDSAVQRKNMVDSQVRPSDVTDRRIARAMLER